MPAISSGPPPPSGRKRYCLRLGRPDAPRSVSVRCDSKNAQAGTMQRRFRNASRHKGDDAAFSERVLNTSFPEPESGNPQVSRSGSRAPEPAATTHASLPGTASRQAGQSGCRFKGADASSAWTTPRTSSHASIVNFPHICPPPRA